MNRQEVFQLCGKPFSGKSTFAVEMQTAHPELVIVSFDLHKKRLLDLGASAASADRRKLWSATEKEKLAEIEVKLNEGSSVIVDSVSPTRKSREDVFNLTRPFAILRQIIYFDLPQTVLTARMYEGDRHPVNPDYLEIINAEFEEPTFDEGLIVIFKSVNDAKNYLGDFK